jgi:hypothetical protein
MKIWFRWLGCMICMLLPTQLWATTVFSTFGPGYSFSQTSYTPVNFYTPPYSSEIIGTSLAYAFDVPGQSDFLLSEIKIAASWGGTKENAHFLIFSDIAGLPADVPLLSLATNPDTLLQYPDVVSLPSPSALTLSAGERYWLVVQPASLDSSVPADDYVSLWLDVNATLPQTVRLSYNSGPWSDWYDPAIQVEAIVFSVEATAVPVPAAAWLFCSGLLGLVCMARRNRAV